MNELTRLQLESIGEVTALTAELGVDAWLRGGWAMDFVLGTLTRPHLDVDWYVRDHELGRLASALEAQGWQPTQGPPPDQQRDLRRGDVELGLAPVRIGEGGVPVVGGGPWAGAPLPPDMLEGARRCVLLGVAATAISPAAQIELKRMMPTWVPGMRTRAKDLEDIARIQNTYPDRSEPDERVEMGPT